MDSQIIQISAILVAIAVGYPVAKYYWHKYQVSYDLDVHWHTSKNALRCSLKIINPNNRIIELKSISAHTSQKADLIKLKVASDIPIVRADTELYFPSHFQDSIGNNIKIKKDIPYSCSFFVKIPEEITSIRKLFINLNISTRHLSINDSKITIIRDIPHI